MSVSPLKSLTPALLPVVVLLISMLSLKGGASLAKTLFPTVGATGITALRLGFGTVILCLIFKPWRLRFRPEQRMPLTIYGLALGTMNFLFYLSIRTVPLGIAVGLEFVGPLTLALLGSRRPLDFLWVILAVIGLWFLLPFSTGITSVDPIGALFALGAGVCWAVYILSGQRAGAEHGAATVAIGSLIASLIFVPVGLTFAASGIWQWSVVPVAILVAFLSTALPYSLEMMALTHLPARIFGTLMSLEPAVAALSGMLYLNESLSGVQCLALLAIILASSGATLTMRPRKSQLNAIELSDNKKK
ncbi:threonine/homoserine exporter RhtA [Pantoea stewartii]|uniref:Threonine/homoserine exporter RhtA n=1 Tax=Pantoea stewartii subsp. stewartii DC283 TaxID=660596 RepID=A0ABN4Z4H4_PANSE|nr:threonine/homoserine exporter RhtA [Pantoea stewartii]ARF49488.1 threonine/homoserine exporter RhtA [Pantoea stewartii subsp. stewartii DC283]KAB0553934.1 threonine/homoserine exporter RhtA [Pantoea stewartii subsp. stewartii]